MEMMGWKKWKRQGNNGGDGWMENVDYGGETVGLGFLGLGR